MSDVTQNLPFMLKVTNTCEFDIFYPDGRVQRMPLTAADTLKFGECKVLTEAASVAVLQDQLKDVQELAVSHWAEIQRLQRLLDDIDEEKL